MILGHTLLQTVVLNVAIMYEAKMAAADAVMHGLGDEQCRPGRS